MGKLDRDEAVLQHAALCRRVAKVVGGNTFLIVEIRHEEVERSNIPVRDDRIYVFYRNTLLRRERDISDWHYQSRVIEDLQRECCDKNELLRLSAYVNANLVEKRADIRLDYSSSLSNYCICNRNYSSFSII